VDNEVRISKPFTKGGPGGPGGASALQRRVMKIRHALSKAVLPARYKEAAENLVEIACQREDMQAAIQAFNTLSMHLLGKPRQQLEITHHQGITEEERRDVIARMFALPQHLVTLPDQASSVPQPTGSGTPAALPAPADPPPPVVCRQDAIESGTHPSQIAAQESLENVNLGNDELLRAALPAGVRSRHPEIDVSGLEPPRYYCPDEECGFEVDSDWMYCPKCGDPLPGLLEGRRIESERLEKERKARESSEAKERARIAAIAAGANPDGRPIRLSRMEKYKLEKKAQGEATWRARLDFLREREKSGTIHWRERKTLAKMEADLKAKTGDSAVPLPDSGSKPGEGEG
jgi:hypothetical protein